MKRRGFITHHYFFKKKKKNFKYGLRQKKKVRPAQCWTNTYILTKIMGFHQLYNKKNIASSLQIPKLSLEHDRKYLA